MPSKKIPQLSRDGNRSGRQSKYDGGATAHLLNADPDRMHVRLFAVLRVIGMPCSTASCTEVVIEPDFTTLVPLHLCIG